MRGIPEKALPSCRSRRNDSQGVGRPRSRVALTGIMDAPPITEAIERLKAVFAQVPGTKLSVLEAARLSGLEPAAANRFSMPSLEADS